MGQLQTMAEYTDEDGAIHQVPVKLDNDNQVKLAFICPTR